MSLYSRFIQSKVQKSSLSLFFWIGIGFVVFGIFRIITQYLFKDSSLNNKTSNIKTNNRMSELDRVKSEKERYLARQSGIEGTNFGNSSSEKSIVECSRCLTKHYSNSRFCHMCGASLK